MKLELFDDDGNYIPNPSEPRPIKGEPMKKLCKDCAYHSGLYDPQGKKTGDWCVIRNGRLAKGKTFMHCTDFKPKGKESR